MKPLPLRSPARQALEGPQISRLLAELETALAQVPPEETPTLLGEVERLRARLWGRMMEGAGNPRGSAPEGADRLLTVEDASERLGLSKDWLYRHADKLPFSVRIGPRQLRFSAQGIEKYIRQRAGRG